jgi:hypothetical protein
MDEAHCCDMLAGHIKRLGAVPSQRTGDFREKVHALQGMDDRLQGNRRRNFVAHVVDLDSPGELDAVFRGMGWNCFPARATRCGTILRSF